MFNDSHAIGVPESAHGDEPNVAVATYALPASFAQQRLWFLSQLNHDDVSYLVPWAVRLDGHLNHCALERALNEIVARHEILRTTFVAEGDEVLQIVSGSLNIPLPTIDLTEDPDPEESIRRFALEEVRQPFDLKLGPLLRVRLLRLGPAKHVLLLTLHHIVFDGWSRGIFARELSELYAAFTRGAPSPLPPVRLQYADFAVWQRDHLQGKVLEDHLAYCRRTLAGAPAETALPFDRPRPQIFRARGAQKQFRLGTELSQRVTAFSQRHGATLFITLLAAFEVFLARYTGQEDIVIGTPIANRNRKELENLIGFFANTLALRFDLSAGGSFLDLLARAKAVALEAYKHQDLPFEKVVKELNPDRQLSHNPLFQVMFSVGNVPRQAIEMEGIELRWEGRAEPTAKFDLLLLMHQQPDHLAGVFEYNTDLFDESTIDRMIGHFQTLLDGLVSNPQAEFATVPMLSESERRQALFDWNDTKQPYPERCVHELFEEQVRRNPEAIAVVSRADRLTYGELNSRADRLATHLRARGVGTGTAVGLFVERAPEVIVGLLAVLKAGGAYLPLDPAYPVERLLFMARNADAKLILTQSWLSDRLPPQWESIVRLDRPDEWEARPRQSQNAPKIDDLAYLMFTSGSTGQPKAVEIPHRAIVRLLMGANYATLDSSKVLLHMATLSFDASTFEIWGPLLHGGKLVLYPGSIPTTEGLRAVIAEEGVTTLFITTALFNMVIDHAPAALKPIRQLLTGGEAHSVKHIRRALEMLPDTELSNIYGPTESTTFAAWYTIPRDLDPETASIPLGRPISNTTTYVLDRHLQLAPIGIPGELYIGGDGLARGYLGQPELTAKKFIPNPFSDRPSDRLYATGDLVRYLPDGRLDFIARLDNQIKLRGFRIELGEVEAALGRHPGVKECAVILREDVPGDKRLVAYLVPRNGLEIPSAELNAFLRVRLAEYMIPSAYLTMESLPLTLNGKVNRKALPAPGADAYAARAYEAPQGEMETVLAAIWADALKRDRVGRHDNFFELGGHSLLLVTVIERMRQRGIEIDLRVLFAAPTIAEVAAAVANKVPSDSISVPPNGIPAGCQKITPEMLPLIRLTPNDIDLIVESVPGGAANVQDIYPLGPLQEGILFHHLMEGEGDPYLLARTFSFDTRERLNAYLRAMQAVVDRHDMLRTAVLWEGLPEPVQVVYRKAELQVEEVELDPGAGDVAAQLYDRFNPRRYRTDVRCAPLLRLYIAHDPVRQRWMMMELLHHLAGDHSTRDVIREEIQALLLGQTGRLPTALPFRNLVAQARLGVAKEEHEAFFREMLSDVDEPTAPFGLLDVRGDGTGIQQAHMKVEPALALRVRQRARSLGVSAASLWHLAFAQMLARVSGREDVVFGTVLFGRMQGGKGSDRVIGLFINTLPIRIRTGAAQVERSVKDTHTLLAKLMRHEHASLALAQRCSAVAAPAPLFSALLNYRHSSGSSRTRSEEEIRAWQGIQLLTAEERTNYPLLLSVDDLGDGFRFHAQIRGGIDPMRVCLFINSALESLIRALETTPSVEMRNLNILPDAERNQVLYGWNDTACEYPHDRALHELFEAQAALAPERIALTAGDERITYGELNARANQLAHYLKKRGVTPDGLIGLCMDRTPDMLVALLGILKAGGAYLPLDPDYPLDRLRHILQDAHVPVVITLSSVQDSLPGFPGEAIPIDRKRDEIAREPQDNLPRVAGPQNLAYVLYTSGSTGKPKGVQITHRNVVNFLASMRHEPGIEADDRLLAVTTLSFDIAGLELYLPLISGAEIILASRQQARDGRELLALFERWQPTLMQATPATWWMLLEVGWAGSPQLKALCGGEALPPELAERLVSHCGSVWNMYGPTETTIWSAVYRVESGAPAPIPIGHPIANTSLYVLDGQGTPVPAGVRGELYIGGDGVAKGYLKRPELNAERFLPDPYRPGGLMYRTGDIASFLPDGNVQYWGRTDHQVKIRGFRIELGEIESALAQHPAVMKCVVVAREDAPGEKRLVAYAVFDENQTPSPADLRSLLQKRLPEYMVPSAFVSLPSLPLTPSGKIDRKALPAPEYSNSEGSGYVPPRTPLEEKLVAIWSEVLKLPQIGVHDDFFELGGHSLLAVNLFARMEREIGEKLPLNILFTAPTVALIAAHIGPKEFAGVDTCIKPCRTGGSRPPIFAAHGIGGTVLTFRRLAKFLHADQPIYCLEALGLNDGWRTLPELASRYTKEIVAFQPEGPYHLIGSSFGGMVAFEIARQLRAQGHEVGLVGLLDSLNMGARNLLSRRERFENSTRFVCKRVLMHIKRFPDRALSQWPRYAIGRVIAVGRRLHGALWRTAYRSIRTASPEKPSILLNMKRAYELAGMDYYPQIYGGRVVLFRRQKNISKLQIQRQHGWTGLAAGGLEIIEVPGDHNSIMSEPNVQVLAHEMTKWLERYAADRAATTPQSELVYSMNLVDTVSRDAT